MSTIEIAQSVADGVARAYALPAAQLQALPWGTELEDFVLETPQQAVSDGRDPALPVGGREGSTSMTVDGANTRLAFGGSRVGGMRGQSASLMGPGARRDCDAGGTNGIESCGRSFSWPRECRDLRAARMRCMDKRFSSTTRTCGVRENPFTQWVKQTAPASVTTIPVFTAEPYTPGDREKSWGLGMGGRVFDGGFSGLRRWMD